jgi:small nuclear ribonucleoprotein (snRNP)-like protein
MKAKKRFEPSVVLAPKPTSPDSPIAYVQKFLGRTVNMALHDGRSLEGTFVALDRAGHFFLTGVRQTAEDGIYLLPKVMVPFRCIKEMSAVTPIEVKPATGPKR